ncbi:protein disulfide isomerase-like 5-4 [Ricinus communis]|uniref:Thioredoxin domain-containing protein, putative n=1 Tax=Ricinus communis TaxID=3988 RepID=B9SA45_RICCO|nr:protein disulfide isomerase-like 5-4 [Ricinus communis]EEF39562.1 thioredoxin domain-containing protein, putative [Ricinus communis]|eukprot:XP_002522864.1 protein disulfide isomerase-like 5-4 [Ricinus communis]
MISSSKLKSVDFYRKIPRDLTEASLSGAGLSIIAALSMVFLFGMELSNYLTVNTSTSVIVDKSSDGDFLRIDFNLSFPALSCEFASVDVSDVLGTNRLNITKTIRKFSIDHDLNPTGSEFQSGPVLHHIKHGDEIEGEVGEGSVSLNSRNFDQYAQQYPILVVNFYAPWCYWSNRLKPSWESAAKIMRERYDPEMDGRILLVNVDCTADAELCRRNHIQGYPSIRIFRKGSDIKDDHGHHDHESYYGDRDTESLVKTMESLVAPIQLESLKSENATQSTKRPAPLTGGCRIEGYVRVKKVPGNLIISARSGAHSFDPSQMNMSHVISHLSFGLKVSPKVMNEAKRLVPYIGGSHDKLNGRSFVNHRDVDANVTIEHYLQIVKTEVVTRRSSREHKLLEEYEYTAHSSLVQSVYIPAAKFHFELSPMQVLITENPKSFSHFITNVCAIIGGVFTVAGILDSILHHTVRLMKKVELGKNF